MKEISPEMFKETFLKIFLFVDRWVCMDPLITWVSSSEISSDIKCCKKINWHTLKFSRIYMSINQFQSGSTKLKVVKCTPSTGARGEDLIEKTGKQSKEIIWLAIT